MTVTEAIAQADAAIALVDTMLARRGCHYCRSGLYHVSGPCPRCTEHRSAQPDERPTGPVECRIVGRILSIR